MFPVTKTAMSAARVASRRVFISTKAGLASLASARASEFPQRFEAVRFNSTAPATSKLRPDVSATSSVCIDGNPLLEAVWSKGMRKREQLKSLKKNHANVKLGDITVDTLLSGMKGGKLILWDISKVDPIKGLIYRGQNIDDLMRDLPRASNSRVPLSEGLLWLLLTGDMPTAANVSFITGEIHRRQRGLSARLSSLLVSIEALHPMTQFIAAVSACIDESSFTRAFFEEAPRETYWMHSYEDALQLIAMVPVIAAHIYRRTCMGLAPIPPREDLDLGANLAHMMGHDSADEYDALRLYLFLHADHEGGNVSAHASHLVGSALGSVFHAYAAAMCGLAGPRHGLANQNCLRFLKNLQEELRSNCLPVTKEAVQTICRDMLARGQVIPGFGHGVLRAVDVRFTKQNEFCAPLMQDDPLFVLLEVCKEAVPEVLLATGKVSNPYPNVDCHSGVLLNHFGISDPTIYTVLFGVSRSIGIASQYVWSRIFEQPLERPKSMPLNEIESEVIASK